MGSGSSKKPARTRRPVTQISSMTDGEGPSSAHIGSAAASQQKSTSKAPATGGEAEKAPIAIPPTEQATTPAESVNPPRPQIDSNTETMATGDLIETELCKVGDLQNGEMREFTVEEAKVLLVKDHDQFHAIGGKCTHFGAGLSKGAYSNGHVRCPWHGACFNVKTGDIEDFPGLDSLQCFQVKVDNGNVKLTASKQQLAESKRVRTMCPKNEKLSASESVVIVGGGASAGSCVESLRYNGFAGRIVMITQEDTWPYDRTKLSKAPDAAVETIQLRTKEFYEKNGIEIRMGQPVIGVNFEEKKVLLADETFESYKYLVLATGGSPRHLTVPGSNLRHIYTLRSPIDGKLMAQDVPGKHLVIVGASFIGMELACWAVSKKAESITVVCQSSVPYERTFGREIGEAVRKLFIKSGVKFVQPMGIQELIGDEEKNLTGVVLKNGTTLKADVLIAGIGVEPSTSFIRHSGLRMNSRGYIQVNTHMQTSDPDVYACGDIVEFPLSSFQDQILNVQHWQMALKHGKIAGQAIAGKHEDIKTVPYFWTVLFGKSIRYTGYGAGYDKITFHGEADELRFVAYFLKQGELIAVATVGRDPVASQIAECFRNGKRISAADIEKNETDDWASLLR